MSILQDIVDWGMEHEKLFRLLAILCTIAAFMFFTLGGTVLGWWLRHHQAKKDLERYENMESGDKQIVFEAHVLTDMLDGTIQLDVESWGPKRTLSYTFNDDVLEREVEKAAKARDGLILLREPGQYLMMSSIRDTIIGNDWTANADALAGRPVEKDQIAFAPVSWPGMREAHLIRVVILNPDWLERLCDPKVINRIHATDEHYQYRRQWLHDIARLWVHEERRKGRHHAKIWQVAIRAAKASHALTQRPALEVVHEKTA